MKSLVGAMVFMTLLLLGACEKLTQPRLGPEALALQELSTLVTETYLKLEGIERFSRGTLKLYRNGKALWERPLTLADTVLYDSTLQPARRYTYRAELWAGNRRLAQSAPVTVTTMDTTSHAFEWEVIEFPSPYGSGALYDVAIIDENNIWAVGEIYSDSAQPWLPYNAVHWDGEKWELKRIPFYDETGYAWYTPIKSILAFSEDDIWFEAGIHWNGTEYESRPLNIDFPSHVNKMWGTSSDDFYIVGNNGLIAHYDGRRWRRIESGVETMIQDVWGAKDLKTGEWVILCAVSNAAEPGEQKVIQIQGLTVRTILNLPVNRAALTVWFPTPNFIFVGGDGIFIKKCRGSWQLLDNLTKYAVERIRGTKSNDVFVVGHFGLVMHYNGMSWHYYPRAAAGYPYYSCDYKNSLLVAVGIRNHRPVILRMWR